MFLRIVKSASTLVALIAFLLALPSLVHAQAGIAGVVRDSTGAALPGVMVEASSPALIEKARSVTTDGAGQYSIVNLSPGTYEVTFTLQGFRTVRRTGVILEGTFTAQVNADLAIGSLEETITVAGASPVVDVVNNRQQIVVNREMLDSIPTATRSLQARANLIPGTVITPGGSGQTAMTIHGSLSNDQVVMVDGMRLNLLEGQGQFSGVYLNDGMAQEISYDTGAGNAEVAQGGLRVNMIPREGGNRFSGAFFAQGSNGPLQSDNRSPEVIAAGIEQEAGLDYTYEINPSFGGPIKRDRLWFYLTYKLQDTKNYVPGAIFESDGSPAFTKSWPNYSFVTRLTWQATERDKVRFYFDKQQNGGRYSGVSRLVTAEASHLLNTPHAYTPQLKWTQTTTNRLMLEAGITLFDQNFLRELQSSVGPTDLRHLELNTGMATVAYDNPMDSATKNWTTMASLTYVTGSHSFKTGMSHGWGERIRTWQGHDVSTLRFRGGSPSQVTVKNMPVGESIERMNADFGAFVQDTWTLRRTTLNLGGRYDYFNAEVPAASSPAGTFVPAREVPAVKDVPNWHDWAIRFGVSHDLFGNGKTAVKGNVSKYVASEAVGYASLFNTLSLSTQNVTWTDRNGDRTVLNPDGSVQIDEIGARTANFGLPSGTNRPDPDLKRGHNWEYSVQLQHELFPRVSVTGGYYRRTFHNLQITDNLNLSPTDWTPVTIVAPSDGRLPGGGNYPVAIFTRNAGVTTAVDNLRTFSTDNSRTYNGMELNGRATLPNGAIFLGGITTERTASISCDQRDNPNNLRFCDSVGPFRTQLKLNGTYPLPYDFNVSGAFTSRPGGSISADYEITTLPDGSLVLGANGVTRSIEINLFEPATMFLDRINQVDLRLARTFRFGRYRIQGMVDFYNVLNAGSVTSVNETFSGGADNEWLAPTSIQVARYVRFGGQISF
jgi:hypothetical protein